LMVGIQPSNSFTRQFQWGTSLNYHLSESFGIEVLHIAFASNSHTDLEKVISDATGLLLKQNESSVLMVGGSLLWTPFRSKAAMKTDVYHFEGYLIGGG